jgi:hypothetical protein
LKNRKSIILKNAKDYLANQVCGSLNVTLFEIRSLADDLSSEYGQTVTSRELIEAFETIDRKPEIEEPIIKVGDVRKCYGGLEYKVLEVSNTYNEVSEYDINGTCQDVSTDEQLIECGLNPDDVLYCAVESTDSETRKYIKSLVFVSSRDSIILGE